MLFRSPLISDASGQIDGMIAARGPGGLYFRSKVVVPDTPSTRRTWIRTAMANTVARWKADLSQSQRDTWEAFARSFPSPGRLGNVCRKGGMDEYIRANVTRNFVLHAFTYDLGWVDAPSETRGVSFEPLTIKIADGTTDTLQAAYTLGDDWIGGDQSGVIVWVSTAPVVPTRNFYARGYLPFLFMPGSLESMPVTQVLPYDLVPDRRCFWRYRIVTADGRLSPEVRGFDAPG